MIYQFLPDCSGEVIAEVRQSSAEPFLGPRYPASGIPPQAANSMPGGRLRPAITEPRA